jgi:plastocyanin/methionine-rich copper-binding protein CopC
MKVSRTTLLTAVVTAALTLLAAACSGGDSPTAPQPAAAPSPTAVMEKKDDAAMTKKDGEAMMDKTPEAMMDKKDGAMMGKIGEQRFAAHFVDSAPAHGESFAASPNRIVINFDFTLGNGSAIKVTRDGHPVATPAAAVSGARKLTLETALPAGAGDGTYSVDYKACWPDGSCHDGQFGFIVDGKLAATYTDMTGKAAVSIGIANIAFTPATLIVSKGTKVTWTNTDPVAHFVNTDPHPTHNHSPGLNSLDLAKGATYSFTFDQPGEYPYHCSAHTNMRARVLVKG